MMINPARPIDDDELLRLGAAYQELTFERESDGALVVSPPPPFRSAIRVIEAVRQLNAWGEARGYAVGDGAGYRLPDTSVRVPDASWVSFEAWNELTDEQRENLAPFAPEIAIEIVSPSDTFARQRDKAQRYVEQGTRYAVVIDPRTRRVEEFGRAPEGLALDFDRIIDAGAPRTRASEPPG
jgi:Uma2 family endonuclease